MRLVHVRYGPYETLLDVSKYCMCHTVVWTCTAGVAEARRSAECYVGQSRTSPPPFIHVGGLGEKSQTHPSVWMAHNLTIDHVRLGKTQKK